MENWNLTKLTTLFAADPEELGDVDVSAENDVLRVTLKEKGGLDVFVAASGEDNLLVSCLLTPCDQVNNRAGFERLALRTHKLIPLSSFGIVTVDGQEWYELFGSLSSHSTAELVVQEVAILASNAVDAASLIQEWNNGEIAA